MTEKKPAHTAGRLGYDRQLTDALHPECGHVQNAGLYGLAAVDGDEEVIAEVLELPNAEANASRLVACWNALDGVADPEEAVRRWKRMEADEQAKLDDTFALDALDACSPCSLVIEESGEARVTLWRDGEPLAFIGDNVREALAALGGMEVRGE